jgi:hypothetical protein
MRGQARCQNALEKAKTQGMQRVSNENDLLPFSFTSAASADSIKQIHRNWQRHTTFRALLTRGLAKKVMRWMPSNEGTDPLA